MTETFMRATLPFLTVLATSKKTDQAQERRHKTSIDWIRQMILVVRRWLPKRELVVVVVHVKPCLQPCSLMRRSWVGCEPTLTPEKAKSA